MPHVGQTSLFIAATTSWKITTTPPHTVTTTTICAATATKPILYSQTQTMVLQYYPLSRAFSKAPEFSVPRRVDAVGGCSFKGSITGCRPSGELPTCHLHPIFPHLDTRPGPGRALDHEPDLGRGPENRTCESSQLQRRPRPSFSAEAGADGLGPYKLLESHSADPELCIDPVGQYITVRK
ncbi:hypothetical protein QBC32DRAFT_378352 [Pseudoneurospora amorphoporcata]|uniref:Uncharacterized protein n=1 Tax=Pseudoneurospora amorphoporcata TaxID=241081 RepID=A0AAN6P4K5_9PEZI|nr:hypothetical protein QBC32DRAFT_378352 [Pseudoneurospora amorphoporcata]